MTDASIDRQELTDSVRNFLNEECTLERVAGGAAGDRAQGRTLWSRMAELGWFAMLVSRDDGGLGFGYPEVAVLYEELGRALAPVPMLQAQLAIDLLQRYGSSGQRARWLSAMADGELKAGVHLPGPLDVLPVFDEGSITGTWSHVVDADFMDLLFLPCRSGVDLVFLPFASDVLEIAPRTTLDLTRQLCEVNADALSVSVNDVIVAGDAAEILLDHASLGVACDCAGGAARILEITVEYMKTRTQFERPIGSFQALKHRCAQWKILQEAVSALAHGAAAASEDRSVWCSNARFEAAEAYAAIAGDAIQLHGGIGFTWDYVCHLFFKRAKLNEMIYGDAAWHKDRVARLMFDPAQWADAS